MTTQLCTFHVGESLFGIDVTMVQEVMRYQTMTRVPLASPIISGLINLRGQIVTAVDMRRRLGLPPFGPEQLPMNVIVRLPDGAVSLLVDEIGEVMDVSPDTFERPPETLTGAARELIRSVCKLPGSLLLVLGAEQLTTIDPDDEAT
jgi:purine-binding chemotaxis protein CheW